MDLVSQVRAQHQQQQREASVRRITQPLIVLVICFVVLVVALVSYERYALRKALDEAHEHLRLGGMFELLSADSALQSHIQGAGGVGLIRSLASATGLSGVLNDEPARATLALVRARLLVDHDSDPAEIVGDGVPGAASPEAPEAGVLQAAVTLVSSQSAEAAKLLEASLDRTSQAADESWFLVHHAWLTGVVALHDPQASADDRQAALATLQQADPEREAWPGYAAVQARLFAGLHDFVHADEVLTAAEQQGGDASLVYAIQAWLDASAHAAPSEVASALERAQADTRPVDVRSRVFAAMATALLGARGQRDDVDVSSELATAWASLPVWDVATRRALIETAAETGQWERVDKWLEERPEVDEDERLVLAAWRKLSAGEARAALAELTDRAQEHPRVAYIQGLALVEETRWAEAAPWLGRAATLLPGRPEIKVAWARVALRSADTLAKTQAKVDLLEISKAQAYAARAFTGLGEAHLLASAEPNDTDKLEARRAFLQATKTEVVPAEAWLQLAELPASLEGKDASEDANPPQTALEALRKAAQLIPDSPRYVTAYGKKLADLGYTQSALAVCLPLAKSPSVDAAFLLELIRLAYVEAQRNGTPVPDEAAGWLERAAKLGASVPELVHARTQLDIASNKRASWNRARSQMAIMLAENPNDTASRKLLVEAILRSNDGPTALATIEAGLPSAEGIDEAELILLMAEAEAAAGDKRAAARNAWRGWKKLIRADATAAQLLPAAERGIEHWYNLKQPSNSRSIARDLSRALPHHPAAWVIRGEVQMETGFPHEGCDSAEKALELDAEYAPGHALHAACLAARGQKDEARAAYQKAAELAVSANQRDDYKKAGRKL